MAPMLRTTFIRMLVVIAATGVSARAADRPGGSIADLADRLATGLRVKAPADVAFCEQVAVLVREGRLPVAVVDSTYSWAIARGKKYPFPAFQHVIRIKAAKLGVPL
jgi:hypothetical protein